MKVIKRDKKTIEWFDRNKIINAIMKAGNGIKQNIAEQIANEIAEKYQYKEVIPIDVIEADVFDLLVKHRHKLTARSYEGYRSIRAYQREVTNTTDEDVSALIGGKNEYYLSENSNKNPRLNTTIRDYLAAIMSDDITRRYLLPPEILRAHEDGEIHFHDRDYYIQRMHNCDLINLDDMLQNGTVISDTLIEKPKCFSTACNIATQAIAQIASSQYGGQSISLAHLSPFVNESRKKFRREVKEEFITANIPISVASINAIAEMRVHKDIEKGVQTIQYQVVTLMTTNGQAPFITVFMNINEVADGQDRADLAMVIEEVLRQRIQGVKNEEGEWITPAFPKLIYLLDENNAYEGTPYWYLTQLAAQCTAKRMVPDYISAKKMRELKGDIYTCMGCRSFLTPDRCSETVGNIAHAKNYVEGQHKYYGRFNAGVVTLNLVDIALSSEKNEEKFWEIFEERTELCHKALKIRHDRLLGTKTDVAPILWQYGALARLPKGATIDELLYHGYSTLSLGYAGLYECVKYMTGHSHSDESIGEAFGLKVMKALNDKCTAWKLAEDIDYSLYGTPLESTTEKFAKKMREKFGEIEGITDRNYITNSYHIPVFEQIDPFEKLRIESKFQELSPGGAISYIETADMTDNIDAVLKVMQYIYENIMYAELNTKSDYCECCGYDKAIDLIDENGKLIWKCPNCGNTDATKMNIARRTCGYVGTAKNGWNQGRLGDIHDRYVHLDNTEVDV